MSTIGRIHSFQSFGTDHGPGIRFIVFMQGCDYRCPHCPRPDCRQSEGGKAYSPQQVITKVVRHKEYWGKEGGLTVSGGEPLMQIDFLIALFSEAKKRDISTCLETSGFPFSFEGDFFRKFGELVPLTDLFLVSIKTIDEEKSIKLTGQNAVRAKEMLEYLSFIGKKIHIRYELIPGVTDKEEDLEATAIYLSSLNNIEKIDVLPHRSLRKEQYAEFGIAYQKEEVYSPSIEEIEKAKAILVKSLH